MGKITSGGPSWRELHLDKSPAWASGKTGKGEEEKRTLLGNNGCDSSAKYSRKKSVGSTLPRKMKHPDLGGKMRKKSAGR